MALYRIYIDEVGNHDLDIRDIPNERFLSLTGVIIEFGFLKKVIVPEMVQLKKWISSKNPEHDPDEPIIFHRKDILKKRGPFKLLNKETLRIDFDNALISQLNRWEFSVVTVVIDKLAHKDQYKTWLAHPYHYCLQVLLERYVMFLQANGSKGDIMVESRGGKEDEKLKNSFSLLFEKGTNFINAIDFRSHFTSEELKVKPKTANITGLQIADLVAYPSRREMLQERGLILKDVQTFSERVSDLLRNKYLKNTASGEIWGFGKKLLP